MNVLRLLQWALLISMMACNHSNIDPTSTPIRCKTTSEITYLDGVQNDKTLTTYDDHFSAVKEVRYSGTYGPNITIYQNTYEGDLLIKSIPFENNISYGQTVYTYHQNKQVKSKISTFDYPYSHLMQISEYDDRGNQTRDRNESNSPSGSQYLQETLTTYTSENAILKQNYTQNINGDVKTSEVLNEYNNQNQLVKFTSTITDNYSNSRYTTDYTYHNGKLTQEDYSINGLKTGLMVHDYNANNQLVKSTYSNSLGQNVTNYSYTQQGKLSVKATEYSFKQSMDWVEYSYYPTGDLQTKSTYLLTDKRNSATKTLESMYRYDERGNRLELIINGDGIYYVNGGVTPAKNLRTVTEYICR
ncbi:hypothetical protein [Spirosoma aerolatum]|uniref:hypothetical protein n=1 Tax=Spirosoma aerolatum TaxID=1211326 RepID=UPI0012D3119B|nr:hypothetical protein [Spirosoma aerolatum]